MKYKKKILFSIISIEGGGAERQLREILKRLNRDRYELYLVFFKKHPAPERLIPRDVNTFCFDIYGKPGTSLYGFIRYLFLIKKIDPDIIVSFLLKTNLLSLIAGRLIFKKITIISERIYTPCMIKKKRLSSLWKLLIRVFYPLADKISAVSYDVKEGLVKFFSVQENKIRVIQNGIDVKKIEEYSGKYLPDENSFFLACGRLEKQKGFETVIDALAGSSYSLLILGEGSGRKELLERAEKKKVKLILPGYVSNPYPYFKKADIFILSSSYEGFPNVVLEAMACKTPVIASSCPGGVNELIKDGVNGLLVEPSDPAQLRKAIKTLKGDKVIAEEFKKRAYRKVLEYDMDKVTQRYEELFS